MAQYEQLRAGVLAGAHDGPGLCALRQNGLGGWLRLMQPAADDGGNGKAALTLIAVPTAVPNANGEPSRQWPLHSVPAELRKEFVQICAGLLLGRAWGRQAGAKSPQHNSASSGGSYGTYA